MTFYNAYAPGILMALAIYAAATISPGPAMLGTIGTAVANGRRAGVALAAGICCGSLTWGVLAAFGLSTALEWQPGLIATIRLAGGLYMLYLAWRALRAATVSRDLDLQRATVRSRASHFFRGWAIQLGNPTAVFAWAATISLAVKADAPPSVPGLVLLFALVFGLTFYTLLAVVFSTPGIVHAYFKGRRVLDILVSALFGLAAWKLFAG